MLGGYECSCLVIAQAVTPVHAGTGGKGPGFVDLPIQRDFAGYPCIWGSSFKGALRSLITRCNGSDREGIEAIFGPPQEYAHEFAGCVVFSDLKLLAIPGPCGAGICYFTSPLLLNYFREFAELAGAKKLSNLIATIFLRELSSTYVSSEDCLIPGLSGELIIGDGEIVRAELLPELRELFEEVLTIVGVDNRLADWLARRVILVPETRAKHLIGRKLVQYVARVALDYRTKTVKPGALWSEEYVPELTLFSGVILATMPRSEKGRARFKSCRDVIDYIVTSARGSKGNGIGRFYVILGGHETIGKGIVRVSIVYGSENKVGGS